MSTEFISHTYPTRTMSKTKEPAYEPPQKWSRENLLSLLPEYRVVEEKQSARLKTQGQLVGLETEDVSPEIPIYCAGHLELLKLPCVAIVGTRDVSMEGAARARRLAAYLAMNNVVVVSGLAKGVDYEALSAAIQDEGRTIAVIGTPLEKAYPAENKRLQEAIYKHNLLISPFAPGSSTHKGNFPQRNKVMAALSDITVIIEASDTSGTLHQAAECQRLGRWLFIAKSVAEDPNLQWPTRFLNGYKEKARILEYPEDIMDVLNAIH
jgi:DNA processing protein